MRIKDFPMNRFYILFSIHTLSTRSTLLFIVL